ncbi:MAG: S-layer homology domain-containing protein, partial [Acidimicrobiia bacterium]
MPNSRDRRRLGGILLMVMALAVPVLAAPLPPGGSFVDDDGDIHEGFIEAIAAEGITRGCNPPENDRYCPDDAVTRGQMAAFLVRALNLPSADPAPFVDDDGIIFEENISRLYAAGITKGCNPPDNDRFCPGDPVTRGQMAAFMVRGFDYSDRGEGDLFVDDDGTVFEADIDRLGTAGVTKGCNPPANDRFCPGDAVLRDQMASFLGRALGLTPNVPPPRPTTTTTTTTTTTIPTTTTTTPASSTFTFGTSASEFLPDSATVSSPVTIRWTNTTSFENVPNFPHNVTTDSGPWPFAIDQDLSTGESVAIELVAPGTYTFHCN